MKETVKQKTDDHIRETAREVFFGEGRFDATLQELADKAGVNKALLHYYYRDRETLLNTVYEEALRASFLNMFDLLGAEGDFEKKVNQAIGKLCEGLARYPYIEAFIVSRMNARGHGARPSPVKEARAFTRKFLPEVAAYLKKRKISFVTPEEFLLNMMALCGYPPSVLPLAGAILGYTGTEYRKFLKARQKSLSRIILLKPVK